ncbi:MAG: hypothetical protein SGPRY_008921, partial [Prymnesium sp.]
ATRFLWREYRLGIWWWEPIEMLRKVTLAGLLLAVIPSRLAFIRLLVAVVFSLLILVFTLFVRPYQREDNNIVSVCIQLAQIFMYLTAMDIKVHVDFADQVGVSETTDVLGFYSTFDLSMILLVFYGLTYLAFVEEAARQRLADLERVNKAIANITSMRFSACFIKLEDFVEAGELRTHEQMRDQHKLKLLDTYSAFMDFVATHPTWLGFRYPDPNSDHFPAIVRACYALCASRQVDPAEMYVWVDYTSIPQENYFTKQLAIESLAQYASSCRYFLIVAPDVPHADSGKQCNEETYGRRGWCRLEQWARLAAAGREDMFLSKVDEVVAMETCDFADKWFADSIMVFEGDFTCDDDKAKLVDTVLGLWAIAVHAESRRKGTKENLFPSKRPPTHKASMTSRIKITSTRLWSYSENPQEHQDTEDSAVNIFQQVDKLRDRVFPVSLFGKLPGMLEEER